MIKHARFLFYGSLLDFPSPARKSSWVSYNFQGTPAVKDAIEAIGIPHPEVDLILVNGSPVHFSYQLPHKSKVEVYPADFPHPYPEQSISLSYTEHDKFILDVHLGKLNKSLRMLGFDCYYENNLDDNTIAKIAKEENRRVLTRDIGLLKHKTIKSGYWLRSQNPEEQLLEVVRYFKLENKFNPLQRCLVCNERIKEVQKERILSSLPPNTQQHFHQFFQCSSCKRTYWKGSHYDRMQAFIEKIAQTK